MNGTNERQIQVNSNRKKTKKKNQYPPKVRSHFELMKFVYYKCLKNQLIVCTRGTIHSTEFVIVKQRDDVYRLLQAPTKLAKKKKTTKIMKRTIICSIGKKI